MPTIEWDIPFGLTTSAGTLTMNAATGTRYVLDHEACVARPELRTSADFLPRSDGMNIFSAFKTGYHMRLAMQCWIDQTPAMGLTLQAMLDALDPHILALLNADILTDAGGRVFWTPSNYGDDRMLDGCRLAEWPSVSANGIVTTVTIDLQTRFPYGIDATQIVTPIVGSSGVVVTNAGNVEQWPVAKVYGPTSSFVLENDTTGFELIYNDSLPGAITIPGGSYAEVDMFRNTVYLNGNETNLKPGILLTASDFWSLVPGDNIIGYAGGGAGSVLLSNNSWA